MGRWLLALAVVSIGGAESFTCQHEIPVVKLRKVGESEGFTLQEIVQKRWPVVIEGTAAAEWEAVGKWDEQYVKEKLGKHRVEFRSSNKRVFTIRSNSRSGATLQGHSDSEKNNVIQYHNGTIEEMLSLGRYAYYSGPMELDEELEKEISPVSMFSVVEPAMQKKATSHRIIHIGNAGVTAQLHYDKSRNFLAQVYGTKRVIMYKPEMHWDLHVFPVIHPSRRQSQIDLFGDSIPGWASRKDLTNCFDGELKPGQVLYIPSFWWHQIEYTTFALSVSVVSPSIPEFLFSYIYWQPLPFQKDESMSPAMLREAMKMYLQRILPSHLARNVADSRYGPLLDDLVQADASAEKTECSSSGELQQLNAINRTLDEPVSRVYEILHRQLFAHGFQTETEMLFADLLEEFARNTVGVHNVYAFLSELAS